MEEELDVDFDLLVNDIIENPELILQKNLSEEQLLKIQKRINPYSSITGPNGPNSSRTIDSKKRTIVCSYTNLREDYLKRLTMTSLVGCIMSGVLNLKFVDGHLKQKKKKKLIFLILIN